MSDLIKLKNPSAITSFIPPEVVKQRKEFEAQGYKILRVYKGICPHQSKANVKGQEGWCIEIILPQDVGLRKPYEAWVFKFDPLADIEAVSVECEVL